MIVSMFGRSPLSNIYKSSILCKTILKYRRLWWGVNHLDNESPYDGSIVTLCKVHIRPANKKSINNISHFSRQGSSKINKDFFLYVYLNTK